MEQHTLTNVDDLYTGTSGEPQIMYTMQPVFTFNTEVDALQVLQALGEELRNTREHERHVLRYMEAAAKAAHTGTTEGGPVKPQAIINESGAARATVYKWISEDTPER